MFRSATVQKKTKCNDCHLKFICGGGDIEHSYFYSSATFGEGSLHGPDPYCDLHEHMITSILFELADEKRKAHNLKSGFSAPVIFLSMGEGYLSCGTNGNGNGMLKSFSDLSVELSHSNCVLSFDIDKSREAVRQLYGRAAEEPQKELCCPTSYPTDDVRHIPQEVIDRFYGCGSPISIADIKEGETVVDLGSGAGIDCFIAAKKVGAKGKVIGGDMTAGMREVALQNKPVVAKNLGFDVVEFREGYLENPPVEDKTVDL